ncbi:MAG: hypothetical protein WDO74_16960 [Pseudomonadota bacterium]
MAHNTRIRPNLAAWTPFSAVLPSEFAAFDESQFHSINGDEGGLWLPSSKIILGGAGLDVTGPFRSLGASGLNVSLQAQNWLERSAVANPTTNNLDVPIAYAPAGTVNTSGLTVCTAFNTISCCSDDGAVWTSGSDSFGGDLVGPANDIAFGTINTGSPGPGFLISSPSGGKLDKSADGLNWDVVAGGASVVGTKSVLGYGLATWIAAGDGGVVYRSQDYGATWVLRTTPAGWIAGCGGAKRVVCANNRWVILPLGSYNKCLVSVDNGLTWTEQSLVLTGFWTGLAYSPADGLWMVSSSGVGPGAAVAYSTDALTWNYYTSAYGANDLAVIGSLWVTPTIAGHSGGIAWSVDKGVTWQPVAVGNHRVATAGWKRVLAVGNRFIVVHANGTSLEFALSLRSS